MAFAQFYYDPAVEFEKLSDEQAHGTSDQDVPQLQEGAPPNEQTGAASGRTELPYGPTRFLATPGNTKITASIVPSSPPKSANGPPCVGTLMHHFAGLVKRRDSS